MPSTSTRERFSTALSIQWEAQRPSFEATLRQQETLPEEAVAMAVSLEGVMAPMKEGTRQAKRHDALSKGKAPRGPAGDQEGGCATVSYAACGGERRLTRRMARRPEPTKAPLKGPLTAEVMGAWGQRPDVPVVQVAEGTADNWTYLGDPLPVGEDVLAFSHAVDHLSDALGAAYGEGTSPYHERFTTLRAVLRDAPQGVDKVLGALGRLRSRYPRRQAIHKTIAYFREHRHRMRYPDLRAQLLPIGSGVVEAAGKTLVSQRLQRAGMRWRGPGGQAIWTFRAFCQASALHGRGRYSPRGTNGRAPCLGR